MQQKNSSLKSIKKNWLPIGMIVVGLLLRLYHLPNLFHFTYDESVFAYVGRRMFTQGHVPLIGGVTPFHVHLGPYFYWFSAILLRLDNFYPQIWGVFAALLSGVTMVLIYLSGRRIFGKVISIFALFFYAFSYLINLYDRHYWGLVFNPLFTLIAFWSLNEIIRGKKKFYLLLGATLALGFHSDPSTWVLIIVGIITLWYFNKLKTKAAFLGAAIFLISFFPLVVFDIRHRGVNISGIGKYLTETRTPRQTIDHRIIQASVIIPQTLARTLYVFGDSDLAKQYAYCPQYSQQRLKEVPPWAVFLVILFLLIPFIKINVIDTKKRIALKIIAFYFLILTISSTVYNLISGGALFDHYLSTSFPLFAFLIGITLYFLWQVKKAAATLLVFFFIISNLYQLTNSRHSFGYLYKERAVQWVIDKLGDKTFGLESLGSCFKYSGYRYLFTAHGKEPHKSYVDQNFFWLFDKMPAERHPPITVVFVSPADEEPEGFHKRYQHFLSGTIESENFGGIEVLIVDNSSGIYNGDY